MSNTVREILKQQKTTKNVALRLKKNWLTDRGKESFGALLARPLVNWEILRQQKPLMNVT